MKVAIGFKTHSGWAVMVAIGNAGGAFQVVERSRVELVEAASLPWGKAPYHAAEDLKPAAARELVRRAIDAAHAAGAKEVGRAADRLRAAGHDVVGCAVLVGSPLPDWTTDEILAVHMRMHHAEGALFWEALAKGASASGLRTLRIPEKQAQSFAEKQLSTPLPKLQQAITDLGRSVGAPWGKDQKSAALAAMMVLA